MYWHLPNYMVIWFHNSQCFACSPFPESANGALLLPAVSKALGTGFAQLGSISRNQISIHYEPPPLLQDERVNLSVKTIWNVNLTETPTSSPEQTRWIRMNLIEQACHEASRSMSSSLMAIVLHWKKSERNIFSFMAKWTAKIIVKWIHSGRAELALVLQHIILIQEFFTKALKRSVRETLYYNCLIVERIHNVQIIDV